MTTEQDKHAALDALEFYFGNKGAPNTPQWCYAFMGFHAVTIRTALTEVDELREKLRQAQDDAILDEHESTRLKSELAALRQPAPDGAEAREAQKGSHHPCIIT